jgi:hypothetical protein
LYVAEAAKGELKDLMDEVHVRKEVLPFINLTEKRRIQGDMTLHESDGNYTYLMNALFTPLDMTDYEEDFVGWNELGGKAPISKPNWVQRWNSENHPKVDCLPNLKKARESLNPSTGETMSGIIAEKYTEVDPPEYEVYEDDGGEDEEEEEDYGEEGDDEDYGDEYGDEEEDPFEAADARRI